MSWSDPICEVACMWPLIPLTESDEPAIRVLRNEEQVPVRVHLLPSFPTSGGCYYCHHRVTVNGTVGYLRGKYRVSRRTNDDYKKMADTGK